MSRPQNSNEDEKKFEKRKLQDELMKTKNDENDDPIKDENTSKKIDDNIMESEVRNLEDELIFEERKLQYELMKISNDEKMKITNDENDEPTQDEDRSSENSDVATKEYYFPPPEKY